MWIALALGSAFFTAVIGTMTKAGLQKADPFFALAVQATILTVIAWVVVGFQKKISDGTQLDSRSWMYLVAAGVTMMIGYALYFVALKQGESSAVQPLDRLSLVFAIGLAAVFLKEKLNWASFVGGVLMVIGAVIIAVWSPKGS